MLLQIHAPIRVIGCTPRSPANTLDRKPHLQRAGYEPRRGAALKYEFEYWSSLDTRYVTITIEAESRTDAIKEFKQRHPHKKYRLLDPLDE